METTTFWRNITIVIACIIIQSNVISLVSNEIEVVGNMRIGILNPHQKLHINVTNGFLSTSGYTPLGKLELRDKANWASHDLFAVAADPSHYSLWIRAKNGNKLLITQLGWGDNIYKYDCKL